MPVIRLTLFKISEPEAVQQAIKKYTTLTQDALKVRFPFSYLPILGFLHIPYYTPNPSSSRDPHRHETTCPSPALSVPAVTSHI